jgi:hypothetical protein
MSNAEYRMMNAGKNALGPALVRNSSSVVRYSMFLEPFAKVSYLLFSVIPAKAGIQ